MIDPVLSRLDRGTVADASVGSLMVVEGAPSLDEHSGLSNIAEPFAVQAIIAQLAIEAFHKSFLPRTAGCDEGRTNVLISKPAHHRRGGELRTVVNADILRLAVELH